MVLMCGILTALSAMPLIATTVDNPNPKACGGAKQGHVSLVAKAIVANHRSDTPPFPLPAVGLSSHRHSSSSRSNRHLQADLQSQGSRYLHRTGCTLREVPHLLIHHCTLCWHSAPSVAPEKMGRMTMLSTTTSFGFSGFS